VPCGAFLDLVVDDGVVIKVVFFCFGLGDVKLIEGELFVGFREEEEGDLWRGMVA
jgi:hypothetical protein